MPNLAALVCQTRCAKNKVIAQRRRCDTTRHRRAGRRHLRARCALVRFGAMVAAIAHASHRARLRLGHGARLCSARNSLARKAENSPEQQQEMDEGLQHVIRMLRSDFEVNSEFAFVSLHPRRKPAHLLWARGVSSTLVGSLECAELEFLNGSAWCKMVVAPFIDQRESRPQHTSDARCIMARNGKTAAFFRAIKREGADDHEAARFERSVTATCW